MGQGVREEASTIRTLWSRREETVRRLKEKRSTKKQHTCA